LRAASIISFDRDRLEAASLSTVRTRHGIAIGSFSSSMRRSTLAADISAIRKLVRALDRAIVARDAAGLTALLSDDFVGTTPLGQSFAKGDYIKFHCQAHAGPQEIVAGSLDASRIRIHGNCAVVNRRVQVRKSGPGGRVEVFAVQRIEVAVRCRGKWQLVSGQGTRVAGGGSAA